MQTDMSPRVCFTKGFRTELGHKYILVECSVLALCLPVMSKLPVINSCAINRTMIGMSIKRILVLNLCHVLKPFVKSTPGLLQHFLHHKSMGKFFVAQGRVTHKPIDQSGRILNPSEVF